MTSDVTGLVYELVVGTEEIQDDTTLLKHLMTLASDKA